MAKIRVLIADDHSVLRAGLRLLINSQPDMEVVAEATQAQEALLKAHEVHPDVLTLDLSMPGRSSIKVIELLRHECPQTHVLVLTMHDDATYLRAALAAGGMGYLIKTAADTEVLSAIRAVHRGRMVVDANVRTGQGDVVLGKQGAGSKATSSVPVDLLSDREREVLEWLAQGYTNQEVGTRLGLSVKTIETYRARIAEKLGLRSRADLTRYAMEVGLLAPGKFAPE